MLNIRLLVDFLSNQIGHDIEMLCTVGDLVMSFGDGKGGAMTTLSHFCPIREVFCIILGLPGD